MPFNGSGSFSVYTPGTPYVTGTTISSTVANAVNSDFATGLSTAICKDGQTTVTANLPMAGFKHTGVGTATATTQYARADQVENSSLTVLGGVSGADTITATAAITLGAYAAGQTFRFTSVGANTGAVTINIDGLGAKAVTKLGSTALAAGDIPSGAVVTISYDGTRFQLIGLAAAFASTATTATTATNATNLTTTANDGVIGTTQPIFDNSTKLATDAYVDRMRITLGTPQASTSGTFIDEAIPTGVREIVMSLVSVSTNGTSDYLFQLGSGSVITPSGYLGSGTATTTAPAIVSTLYTAGFGIPFSTAAAVVHGTITLTLENASTNTWVCSGCGARSDAAISWSTGGSVSLAGAIDLVRVTTSGGVNTFDAGEINIQYKY